MKKELLCLTVIIDISDSNTTVRKGKGGKKRERERIFNSRMKTEALQ